MKTITIGTKLTAWYSLIMAASLCIFGIVADLAMKGSIHSTVDEGLRQRIEGVRNIIVDDGPKGLDALTDEFQEYDDGQGIRGRLRVVDSSGKLIFVTPKSDFLAHASRNSGADSPYLTRVDGEGFHMLHDKITVNGASYDVVVATAMDDFERAVDRFEFALFLSVPAILIVAALGGYWLSRRALAPVDEITQAARKIGAQDLAQRLTVHKSGDELERLAETLNGMLGRLEAAFQRITKFTADASHELRTPVSVMRASAEIALRKSRTEQEYREALAQILQESERLSQLIEQLLILARSDSGSSVLPMVPTNLTQPLKSACDQASLLAGEKQLAFSARLPEQPLWVQGDSASLERLFLALLDNAVKYTPGGGQIEVQLYPQDGFAIASIRDTGIGVSSEDLPHIFERFYRADRARTRDFGGSGLGLAIGTWIAQVHGGEIRVESEPSRGSCFKVRLPLSVAGDAEPVAAD
jgi:two-component system, OmpR family, heavy metal sensor histidine kinase CusS